MVLTWSGLAKPALALFKGREGCMCRKVFSVEGICQFSLPSNLAGMSLVKHTTGASGVQVFAAFAHLLLSGRCAGLSEVTNTNVSYID
jgi:hypothetical protein